MHNDSNVESPLMKESMGNSSTIVPGLVEEI